MSEIKLQFNDADTIVEGNQLIVRTGDAPRINEPQQLTSGGIISAPAAYMEQRGILIDKKKALVEAHITQRELLFWEDPTNRLAAKVLGKIDYFPDLKALTINSDNTYDNKELYNLLKFKGIYFKNKAQHDTLLDKLKKFEASINAEMVRSNDFKGSIAHKKVVEVKTLLDLSFTLSMPIVQDGKPVDIPVEICVDYDQGDVIFWLESTELYEMMQIAVETAFETELDRFEGFAIMKKY